MISFLIDICHFFHFTTGLNLFYVISELIVGTGGQI